ncbi:MAG: hypothetical protein MMC23_007641 [Stictis urceolatum]|nr:hypothetical protein [Stictis urceolata]
MTISASDQSHFLEHGWIKIPECFSLAAAQELTQNVWTRLGMHPEDTSTWTKERVNMPGHRSYVASEFAPKAWAAICELLGGEHRVNPSQWRDSLIVNLGTEEGAGKLVPGNKLQGWHVDGDFFVHYLDSPEQGLLIIPLFTDIQPGGGGTMLCPGAIDTLARHLYDHPEGVSPRMTPRGQNPNMDPEPGLDWFNHVAVSFPPEAFVEATGRVGDVYLLHPLMLHSASNNMLRVPRIITNPPVSLKAPFRFDSQSSVCSLVEQKTLRALGKPTLDGWRITAKRDKVVPERVRVQQRMKEEELERLKELQ